MLPDRTTVFHLNSDNITEITSYLLIRDLLKVEEVSNTFKSLFIHNLLWKQRITLHYSFAKGETKADFTHHFFKRHYYLSRYGEGEDQGKKKRLFYEKLCFAAREGDLSVFSNNDVILIDLIRSDKAGYSPIAYAKMNNHQSLLDHFFNTLSEVDYEKFHYAILFHQPLESIKSYFSINDSFRFELNTPMPFSCSGLSPIHTALLSGNQKVVEWLLSEGAKITALCQNEKTVFHYAIEQPNVKGTKAIIEMIELLLKHLNNDITQLNIGDKYKHTPLETALQHGDKELITYLVGKGATMSTHLGQIPLHLAAANRRDDVAILNIAGMNKETINKTDNDGMTPLFIAINWENFNMVLALLKSGADFSIETYKGESPAYKAYERYKHYESENEPQGFNLVDSRAKIYFAIKVYKYLKKHEANSAKDENIISKSLQFFHVLPSPQALKEAATTLLDILSENSNGIANAFKEFETKYGSRLDKELTQLSEEMSKLIPTKELRLTQRSSC